MATYGPLVYLDTALLAEVLLVFLVLLAMNLAVSAGSLRGWVLTGIAIGAATIVRPTAMVLLPAFAGVALWRTGRTRAVVMAIAGMTLAAFAVTAPVVVQNWRTTGVPSIQGFGGLNVYLGNSPRGDGMARARPGRGWDELVGEGARAGANEGSRDRYYLRKTAAQIGSEPLAYVRLLVRKAFWSFQAEEIRDTYSFYFFAERFPLLKWLPGFGLVLALAVVGLTSRERKAIAWLLASFVALLLTLILLVVGSRYRAPLVPVLCALAGSGCVVLLDLFRARDYRRFGTVTALGLGVFALTHVRTDAATRNFAEEWSHTALSLLRDGDSSGAEATYRRALDIDPQWPQAWNGLALVYLERGDYKRTADAAEAALRFNPDYATASYHHGLALERLGQPARAIQSYRRALEISPGNPPFLLSLGEALLRQGALDEAAVHLRATLGRTPDDGRVYLSLALIEARRQRWEAAVEEARRAANLLPSSEAAWELLARAAIGARMPEVADEALANAERLGMNPQSVAAGRELVRRMKLR
jgi:tetratricopeptide (TPR) repeat protein